VVFSCFTGALITVVSPICYIIYRKSRHRIPERKTVLRQEEIMCKTCRTHHPELYTDKPAKPAKKPEKAAPKKK
jgi:hypothetical protein